MIFFVGSILWCWKFTLNMVTRQEHSNVHKSCVGACTWVVLSVSVYVCVLSHLGPKEVSFFILANRKAFPWATVKLYTTGFKFMEMDFSG